MPRDNTEALQRLYDSLLKVRPMPDATDVERAWYRGTLHGVKLAMQQLGGNVHATSNIDR